MKNLEEYSYITSYYQEKTENNIIVFKELYEVNPKDKTRSEVIKTEVIGFYQGNEHSQENYVNIVDRDRNSFKGTESTSLVKLCVNQELFHNYRDI